MATTKATNVEETVEKVDGKLPTQPTGDDGLQKEFEFLQQQYAILEKRYRRLFTAYNALFESYQVVD